MWERRNLPELQHFPDLPRRESTADVPLLRVLRTVFTVSYTHLDVYKRQALSPCPLGLQGCNTCGQAFITPQREDQTSFFLPNGGGLLTVGHARTWGKQGRIHKGTVNILWENDSNAFLFIQYKSYCAGDV